MHYLYEHQLGFNSLALGFPSIDGCNAICLQTKSGLFGVHVAGCNEFNDSKNRMQNMAKSFATFATNHPDYAAPVHLFGVCFHQKRGWWPTGPKNWEKELKVYASELGYKGSISGFDLSTVASWPKKANGLSTESAYVEFRRVFDKVTILYKPWNQCQVQGTKASALSDGRNYRAAGNGGTVVDTFKFNMGATSITTDGTGFVVSPEALRLKAKAK